MADWTVLKRVEGSQFDDEDYLIVPTDDIMEGYLNETYDNNGQLIDDEDSAYVEATYINYWNGSNYQTLLINTYDGGYYNEDYYEIGCEEEDEILSAYEEFISNYVEMGAIKEEYLNGYTFVESRYEDRPFTRVWEGDVTSDY